MTSAQKLIKYLALAFAVFLVCAIALGLFEGINALLGIEVTKDIGTKYLYSYDIPGEVNEMEINISIVKKLIHYPFHVLVKKHQIKMK